jgi:hypothetical protein
VSLPVSVCVELARELTIRPANLILRSLAAETSSASDFLLNDFEWSRRSPDVVDVAKEMERANKDGAPPVHSDGFITVDRRSASHSESTSSDVAKRDHSDILWEFIPEGQSRVGSTLQQKS